jgi:hypothetical protein
VDPFLSGSTSAGAAVNAAPSCGKGSDQTTPGSWYTITGDGGVIAVSTCAGTDFDSQISVFTGSCRELMCVDGNNDACGSQSRVDFQSNQGQIYFVVVHGLFDATGNFELQIISKRLALSDLFVDYKVSIVALQDLSSPQYLALDWMAYNDSADLQLPLSDDQVVERFVVVLLYFATDGASWLDPAGFLTSSLNTCAWNAFNKGVGCNDEGSVVTLYFCKFPNSSFST